MDKIDAIYIATPPSAHLAVAEVAYANKKHVLIEKPLSVSIEHGQRLCELAEDAFLKHRIISAVHIGMRYNPAVHQIKSRMSSVSQMKLILHFMQWPRQWQQQPWVAGTFFINL
jgi:predicted dehydrogenase